MIEDKEKYLKEKRELLGIVEDKATDIIYIRKLLDKYGEHTLSELLKDVKGRYELALQMYNSFCKEEADAVKAIGEKYSQSECIEFIATGYSMLDLAILYQQGKL